MADLIAKAKEYLAALESGVSSTELARFFHPDVVQIEFPNRLSPNGARRTLADLCAAAERGRTAVRRQHYEVMSAVQEGARVVLEVRFAAELNVPFGSLAAGDEMRASFAVFLDYDGERIVAQRNYDCFEPF